VCDFDMMGAPSKVITIRKTAASATIFPTRFEHGRKNRLVYYESIKREPKIKSIYECRCDVRLQTKTRKLRASTTLGCPWNWNT
jgi:hypothetical protein